jgi:hypothetical protein
MYAATLSDHFPNTAQHEFTSGQKRGPHSRSRQPVAAAAFARFLLDYREQRRSLNYEHPACLPTVEEPASVEQIG